MNGRPSSTFLRAFICLPSLTIASGASTNLGLTSPTLKLLLTTGASVVSPGQALSLECHLVNDGNGAVRVASNPTMTVRLVPLTRESTGQLEASIFGDLGRVRDTNISPSCARQYSVPVYSISSKGLYQVWVESVLTPSNGKPRIDLKSSKVIVLVR